MVRLDLYDVAVLSCIVRIFYYTYIMFLFTHNLFFLYIYRYISVNTDCQQQFCSLSAAGYGRRYSFALYITVYISHELCSVLFNLEYRCCCPLKNFILRNCWPSLFKLSIHNCDIFYSAHIICLFTQNNVYIFYLRKCPVV